MIHIENIGNMVQEFLIHYGHVHILQWYIGNGYKVLPGSYEIAKLRGHKKMIHIKNKLNFY